MSTTKKYKCWECDFFFICQEIHPLDGKCIRYAPAPMWIERAREWVFPYVNGDQLACGDFRNDSHQQSKNLSYSFNVFGRRFVVNFDYAK